MLGLVLPWWWRWAALGAMAVACMAFGAFKMHEHDQKAYDELAGQFYKFKADVAAAGEAQNKRSAAIAAHDELLKEEADEENRLARDRLLATIGKLRSERSSSSFVPAAPSCPDRPASACLDRAILERAIRDLDAGVQGLVDEGSGAVIDLNTAKAWAGGR